MPLQKLEVDNQKESKESAAKVVPHPITKAKDIGKPHPFKQSKGHKKVKLVRSKKQHRKAKK